MTTFQDVASFIGQASQTEIETIWNLCNQRSKVVRQIAAAEVMATLKPGDRVRITKGISPKYLIGATAVVQPNEARKPGSVTIKLDQRVGKYSEHYPVGVPAAVLEKVG